MEKLMSERIDTEGRMKKNFKEQDRHFVGLGCDNIEMDKVVMNVMSDFSRLKKLVKDLSDRFDEYEGCKVFKDKKVLEKELIIKANVPPNDPNIDASAIVPTPVNPDHVPAQPEEDPEEEEEDSEEEEEDPEEDPEEDDDVMEMDDDAKVIEPYTDDGSNNPPPPNFEDEETPPTSPVIPDADGQPILPIASFGQNL
nr:hypothetical protein [Tanacetum cinerariifolium]